MDFDALVLAGGSGTRLGGVDKPALRVGGSMLLDGVLRALGGARAVVVVGPRRDVGRPVRWTVEHPPGGGPLAALAAGFAALPDPWPDAVVVCAADLVGFGQATADRLLAALHADARCDGAVLRDEGGRSQWLAGAWRPGALRAALPAEPAGGSLRAVLGALHVVAVDALPGEAADVDTPEQLRRARGG